MFRRLNLLPRGIRGAGIFLSLLSLSVSPTGGEATNMLQAIGADTPPQEKQCIARGWQPILLQSAGLPRKLLWKGPAGSWKKGALLVLHGGGGHHFQWCVANASVVVPQVKFSERAISEGFAVFLLDSSDKVTDNEGRVCGKVWDDEVRNRPNLDLPFIEEILRSVIPRVRPEGSRSEVFMTGLSSGGYMTVRAATHFDDLIQAFAPVSSGDPYGWRRICQKDLSPRTGVHGVGYDNETGKEIIEQGACAAKSDRHEKPWESAHPAVKPPFRLFYHERDGINDFSCSEKVGRLLRLHGYPGAPDFVLRGGRRSLRNHLWQDGYNHPILEFFSGRLDQ